MTTDPPQRTSYSFADIFTALASASQFEEVLHRILAVSLRELSADQGSILLLEGHENPQLKMLAAIGLPEEIVQRGYIARKGSISERVLHEMLPLIVNDDLTPPPVAAEGTPDGAPVQVRRRIISAICVPLLARGHVLGTMNLNRTVQHEKFTAADLQACEVIAGQAAIVIGHHKLQEDLRQQEQLAMVGQTVAGISHCVKNMLSGVRGGIGLTEMGIKEKNDHLLHEGFQLLKRSVGTLSNLVLDLLDYSKHREPLKENFEVGPLITQVVETVAYKAGSLKVAVISDVEADLVYYGDRDQLLRSLLNLSTNAIEAAAEGGRTGVQPTVRLRAAACKVDLPAEMEDTQQAHPCHGIQIEVHDNGPGIPEEVQARIWDIFFSTKGSKGTGLGLASARKVIEEHGGRILFETSPSEGTLFRILLPSSSEADELSPNSILREYQGESQL